jgi:hypothetical protein
MRDFADSLKENAAQNTTENTLENTTKTPWKTLRFVVGHANALAGVRHYCNTRSPEK